MNALQHVELSELEQVEGGLSPAQMLYLYVVEGVRLFAG